MRGKPKRTEKWVGAFVLVLLAFIAGTFVLTGGLFKDFVDAHPVLAKARAFFRISEKPLFIADPANIPPPGPPREMRVARTLLPDALAPGQPKAEPPAALPLRADADAAAAEQAGADPQFVAAVRSANARWLFTRAYKAPAKPAIRAQIADLGDPAAALKAFESRKPADGRALAVGRGGWIAEGRAGFWSGRYYTEVTADDGQSATAETAARALGGLQLAYGGPFNEPEPTTVAQATGPSVPAAPAAGVARFADVPGGRIITPTQIDRYAENLYEKIDGKESAFRAFSVVDLKFGQYADPDTRQSFDVYVYDMAKPINAMGIYMSERVPTAPAVEIGREAYLSGTSVFFWKGQYYVNVLGPVDGGEAATNATRQIATAIAETIADSGEPFWADKLLPAEGRAPNSLSYQATSALGYEFLGRMFFARYEADGKKYQMFLTKAVDAAGAEATYDRFAEATASFDKILAREDLPGGHLFASETPMPGRPSKFAAAFHKGPYFGGVYDSEDQPMAVSRAKALFESLSADDPGDPEAVASTAVEPSGEGESGGHDAAGEGSSEGSEGEY